MKTVLQISLIVLIACQSLNGQGSDDLSQWPMSINLPEGELSKVISQIDASFPGQIFFPQEMAEMRIGPYEAVEQPVGQILEELLAPKDLSVLFYRNSMAIVMERSELTEQFTAEYFQALQESISVSEEEAISEVVVGSVDDISLSGETTISGTVVDGENGEAIIGATLLIEGTEIGTATDADGSFTLDLKAGSHVVAVQYVGYQQLRQPIKVISSGELSLTVNRSAVLLDEVVVQAKAKDINIQSAQVSVTRVSTKDIEKLPTFLGEVDIVKGLMLQPGVSTIGEGSSGFNVRGGNVDQNLIMIDEGLIFNASHALGFFSSFNSDIVSEAILYKGTMPASYGGRLSSALDVKVRDGSNDRWHLKGGLGLVSSRINFDGPIGKKKKTTILLAGRSTYSNWLLRQVNVPEVRSSSAYFYDANLRLVHRFDDKNNITVSAYSTEDQFSFNEEFGFDYKTLMGQIQYRHVFGEKTLATTNIVRSLYGSNQDDLEGLDASTYSTGVRYTKAKQNISYLGDGFESNFGVSAIFYQTDGNSIFPTDEMSIVSPEELQDEKGIEYGLYADFDLEISSRLSLIGGVRYSLFQFLGPHATFTYRDPENPTLEGILEPVTINDNVVKDFSHLQPRASFRYKVSPTGSVKGGYGRTVQYINQIYNSETPTPTSFWQLSNQHIAPQLAHNYSLGYFHNFSNNLWITSVEGFYRDIDQLFDFRGFADLLTNEHIETELLNGVGRSYGVELSVNRQVGYLHGWFSYTYSRSERKVDGINDGNWYPSNFDKPHDLSLVTNIQINKRNSVSINFTYGTGRPITVPVNRYQVQNNLTVLNYSDRNVFRIPDYHRLDMSYTLAQGFRKSKKFKTSWTFSIYNVYGRKNPYSVFVEQLPTGGTRVKRLAVLGSAFPSLTFNFELL